MGRRTEAPLRPPFEVENADGYATREKMLRNE